MLPACLLVLVVMSAQAQEGQDDPLPGFELLQPATDLDAPEPDPGRTSGYSAAQVAHGKYLVELLGCGSCHTDGALTGTPDDSHLLAGSSVGISYSDPFKQKYPGVLYPANLTPDRETGLGNWTHAQIKQVLQTGINPSGRHTLSVMPWTTYAKLSGEDADAIVAYLRSLAPVKHAVPQNVAPGTPASTSYIHFGIYRSTR